MAGARKRLKDIYLRCQNKLLSDSRPWLALEAAFLLLFATYLVLHHVRVIHDCASYLTEAQLVLEGQVPYVDFFEVNPPLIIYLNLLPVQLAKTLGLPVTLTFNLCVVFLLVLSVWELRYFLRRLAAKLEPPETGLISLAWIAATVAVYWYWYGEFGQREHLFVLLYLPFLVARVVRYDQQVLPRWIWIAVAVQAGVGACLKPQFVAIVAAVEVVQLARHRRLRLLWSPEMLAFAGVLVSYAIHWLFVPAAMRREYFARWVPAILHGYGAYSVPYSVLLSYLANHIFVEIAALAVVVAGWLAWQSRLALAPLLLSLATASVAGLLVYVQQRKGWPYQLLPFLLPSLPALAVSLVQLRRIFSSNRDLRISQAYLVFLPLAGGLVVCAMMAYVLVAGGLTIEKLELPPNTLGALILENTAPGDKVMIVETTVIYAFPLLTQIDRRPGSRYTTSFHPIAFACYDAWLRDGRKGPYSQYHRSWEVTSSEEKRFVAELADDVRSRAPRVIAVYNRSGCEACPLDLNLHEYLEHMGILAVIRERGYREVACADLDWRVYLAKP